MSLERPASQLERPASQWKYRVAPVLESKVDEFKMLGYSRAHPEDVWKCLTQKVWKGDPNKRLHEITQDILHLSTNLYMSYLTVQAYQDDDLLASIEALRNSEK
ncbi:post-transcriptional regulator [Radiobacillus sp. PE A8.2]|uniref:post-transcriptional regulator n=1 Tax=Radiobacillus sp. PE A8.2 TaxID=3380349 RepID=UPI00388F8DE1